MAETNTNWVYDKDVVTEISKRMLDKAHRMEDKRISDGWRWVKISRNTSVLAPFDKKGRLTAQGKIIIEEAKKTCV